MKLHLPKRLLTALLAAFTAISLSTGSPAWGLAISGSGTLETITLNAGTSYTGAKVTYSLNSDGFGVLQGFAPTNSGGNVVLTFEVDNTAVTSGAALVYITETSEGAKWGIYLTQTEEAKQLAGYYVYGANNGKWQNDTNFIQEEGDTTTMTAQIGGSGTYINTGETVGTTSGSYVYGSNGLKHSSKVIRDVTVNSNLVETFQVQEYSTLTFSNNSGWSRSYSRTGFNNAYSSPCL